METYRETHSGNVIGDYWPGLYDQWLLTWVYWQLTTWQLNLKICIFGCIQTTGQAGENFRHNLEQTPGDTTISFSTANHFSFMYWRGLLFQYKLNIYKTKLQCNILSESLYSGEKYSIGCLKSNDTLTIYLAQAISFFTFVLSTFLFFHKEPGSIVYLFWNAQQCTLHTLIVALIESLV